MSKNIGFIPFTFVNTYGSIDAVIVEPWAVGPELNIGDKLMLKFYGESEDFDFQVQQNKKTIYIYGGMIDYVEVIINDVDVSHVYRLR